MYLTTNIIPCLKIYLDNKTEMYYIIIMKTMETDITFRKNNDGKFMPIIRGGRATRIIKSKKMYNRKQEKAIHYE